MSASRSASCSIKDGSLEVATSCSLSLVRGRFGRRAEDATQDVVLGGDLFGPRDGVVDVVKGRVYARTAVHPVTQDVPRVRWSMPLHPYAPILIRHLALSLSCVVRGGTRLVKPYNTVASLVHAQDTRVELRSRRAKSSIEKSHGVPQG